MALGLRNAFRFEPADGEIVRLLWEYNDYTIKSPQGWNCRIANFAVLTSFAV